MPSLHSARRCRRRVPVLRTGRDVPLLFAIGIALTPWDALVATLRPEILITIVSTVGTIMGTGFIVGRWVNLYPIELAIVNACHSGQGGTGDVAILTAANRMELMPFAQIATRIGGAITVQNRHLSPGLGHLTYCQLSAYERRSSVALPPDEEIEHEGEQQHERGQRAFHQARQATQEALWSAAHQPSSFQRLVSAHRRRAPRSGHSGFGQHLPFGRRPPGRKFSSRKVHSRALRGTQQS